VPSAHELSSKMVIQPSDFAGETLIIYKTESGNDYFIDNVLTPRLIKPGKVIKMQLTEARIELVKAGMGLSVMSRWLAKPFVRDSKAIKLLPITRRRLHRTWYIATLGQKQRDPLSSQFTKFLREQELGVA
jgi:LysR family transcriptional regulator for metE and metH